MSEDDERGYIVDELYDDIMQEELKAETKKCPYCAELILSEAIVCRYCHRDLTKKPKKKFGTWQWVASFIAGASLSVCSISRDPSLLYNNPNILIINFIFLTLFWGLVCASIIWVARKILS